jgi:hypothetical protein
MRTLDSRAEAILVSRNSQMVRRIILSTGLRFSSPLDQVRSPADGTYSCQSIELLVKADIRAPDEVRTDIHGE